LRVKKQEDHNNIGRRDPFPAALALHERLSGLEVFDALSQRLHPPALRRKRVLGRTETVTASGRTQAVLVQQAPDAGEDQRADSDDDCDHDHDGDERLLFAAEFDSPERTLHAGRLVIHSYSQPTMQPLCTLFRSHETTEAYNMLDCNRRQSFKYHAQVKD